MSKSTFSTKTHRASFKLNAVCSPHAVIIIVIWAVRSCVTALWPPKALHISVVFRSALNGCVFNPFIHLIRNESVDRPLKGQVFNNFCLEGLLGARSILSSSNKWVLLARSSLSLCIFDAPTKHGFPNVASHLSRHLVLKSQLHV